MTHLRRLFLALPLLASACGTSDGITCLRATDTVCDSLCVDLATSLDHCGACGETCNTSCNDGTCAELVCHDTLDLLFVVDNSNSMREEQTTLAIELPAFLRQLLGDGVSPPLFSSVHLGVVSTDMGASDTVMTCGNPPGDDGILRSPAAAASCGATAPAFFDFAGTPSTAVATSASCVVTLGTGGCGFEQQLEAGLKALSPSTTAPWVAPGYTPPMFVVGAGHGGPGDANAGFVREGSLLGVFFLTDEEDCSTPTPSMVFVRGTDPVDLNLRCHTYPDRLHPVSRFVAGFAALRGSPNELVVGATVGVPPDAVTLSYDAILADPRMEEQIDPSLTTRLLPSCTSPSGRGIAFPPRRIVGLLDGLEARGAYTSVGSICRDGGYLDAFANAVRAATLPGLCTGR